jgi:hypothetical protein
MFIVLDVVPMQYSEMTVLKQLEKAFVERTTCSFQLFMAILTADQVVHTTQWLGVLAANEWPAQPPSTRTSSLPSSMMADSKISEFPCSSVVSS